MLIFLHIDDDAFITLLSFETDGPFNVDLMQFRLVMEALAIDTEDFGSDVYLVLGLKRSGKGAVRTPRILTLLHSLRNLKENEMQSETANVKVFHGLSSHHKHLTVYQSHLQVDLRYPLSKNFPTKMYFNNAYYAHVEGISTAELNRDTVLGCKGNPRKGIELSSLSELVGLERVGPAKVMQSVLPQLQDEDSK
ncbi:hypothetical protein F3Y22_tig00110860pilonHSYRG00069 [Hibiscus syriacus]|uniref:Uncharacterized protein n=1 Tax=Hibiscus syriacus TaxID=106335 RepID=A0A6A2ZJ55_HIBSY|nr:hypothetical protein F3Y22_tig00110860pilonHSYRG00069 [Hibiscus syriacus]